MSEAAAAAPSRSADLLAGLSIAGLLLPEAVAYSSIAGLPPQAGVMALFAGLVCYGAIGRSRYAIVSATSSSAAVLAEASVAIGGGDPLLRAAFAALLVLMTGACFLLAGAARLGGISNVIAKPVLRGYAFGLALVIAVKQWPNLVGLSAKQSSLLPLIVELLRRVREWHWPSFGCGIAALLLLFLLERLRRLPGTLLVIVAGIAGSSWLAVHGVALTGVIRLALSWAAPALPDRAQWLPDLELAAALMLILYAESYSSIRSFALKHGEAVAANRDLAALGVANVVSGLFHGMPVGAGYSASSANEAAGAQSRLAGLTAAATVLVLVLTCLPWIERIPVPVLAAIVIHAVSKSLSLDVFAPYLKWRRDRLVALAAVVAVIALGVLNGLLVAIGFSLAMLLRTLATPRLSVLGRLADSHDFVDIARHPQALPLAGTMILRPEEPLFFANAEPMLALARARVLAQNDARRPAAAATPVTRVILSLEESPDLDSSALEALADFADWLQARNIELRVARLKEAVRQLLMLAALPQLPAAALDYWSVEDAASGSEASGKAG
ncbi:MFS superfamily sulfate permease-like transporter [Rhodanobacter sp. ANJX3]|uniref:SulP family inorganic anion transporter n=1 Tax=Rhodanobacter sp. ANJX3 TaxID=2723083 RepID=UPI0016197E9F|nr:SulP family inorganic anion transporter [Rhodanobacter sp. ANJX3]MBB5360260.1 MFS superfamily sulfate permease-like transporter [Rhodanobacter sp. ANJX3]